MSNLKTISLIAAEIDKLRAEIRRDREADQALNDVEIKWINCALKRLDERVKALEKGEGYPPV